MTITPLPPKAVDLEDDLEDLKRRLRDAEFEASQVTKIDNFVKLEVGVRGVAPIYISKAYKPTSNLFLW